MAEEILTLRSDLDAIQNSAKKSYHGSSNRLNFSAGKDSTNDMNDFMYQEVPRRNASMQIKLNYESSTAGHSRDHSRNQTL